MNLYEIQTEHLEILARAEEVFSNENAEASELEAVQEALDLNAENFKSKALSYLQFTKNLESDVSAIDAEIIRLEGLKKQKTSLVKNLKSRLSDAMELLGLDKVDLNLFKLSFRKSKATDTKELEEKITSLDLKNYTDVLHRQIILQFPELDYCDISINIRPDKKIIKESIEKGSEVFGSKIVENKSLVIK